ncbi:hypothetical protein BJ741DRAFT_665274 [Chytriomyces cf. hyalinus JEL632]|nr:hypothetical protein BJ741DRAFT_665274 [Chytriomyces cf. hyalinus JEL632]
MSALSIYSSVCIAMTTAASVHLTGFAVFLICSKETQASTRSASRRLGLMTTFNVNLTVMIVSLLLIYVGETILSVSIDYGGVSQVIERVIVTVRIAGFICAQIGYINYSYSRAQGILEQTLLPALSVGLYYVVKTAPLLFLPAVLVRVASFYVKSDYDATLIYSASLWYGAANTVVSLLLDIVFLVSFLLFLRANKLHEKVTSTCDDSLLIVARYGAAGSFLFLSAAGTLVYYCLSVTPLLRLAAFCQFSVISVILTGLKWRLHGEQIRRQISAEARLKDALGSAQLRCIRTRDVSPRGGRSPKLGLEWGFADASGTMGSLEPTKDVAMEIIE